MNKFIEILDTHGSVFYVNTEHIIKFYTCSYDKVKVTRIILTNGGGMIDSCLTTQELWSLIQC